MRHLSKMLKAYVWMWIVTLTSESICLDVNSDTYEWKHMFGCE